MRVWNLTDSDERKKTFDPRVAEVFGVQGRTETRHYSAIAINAKDFANVNPCDYCAFGTKVVKRADPLCSYVHIACKADERADGRQVIFRIW